MFVLVLAAPLEIVQHEERATGKKCNVIRVQQEKNATKTLQLVKVLHEIVQYIRRVQHERNTK